MKPPSMEIVAETDAAVAYRLLGERERHGRDAVVFLAPTVSRAAAADLLQAVTDRIGDPDDRRSEQ